MRSALNETSESDCVARLAGRLASSWPGIMSAQSDARRQLESLRALVAAVSPPANTSIVVFGSLARGEWTMGSDVDWTLLIDGPADMRHFDVAKDVCNRLADAGHKEPGRTGTFGTMSSSHELVHHIGGNEDTNQNITRRMLLVLESVHLSDEVALDRVVKAILERYIIGDPASTGQSKFHVPLFLLNDIVRFWRTLAVDYATKKWQRSNEGWALRNIKLRMSRKLLFVKGLLVCLLCDEALSERKSHEDSTTIERDLLTYCHALSRRTAIELLADVLDRYATPETALKVMDAYEAFIGMLSDQGKRSHLESLPFNAVDDGLFSEMREVSRSFRDGLETLFFDSNEQITRLTKRYGVF